MIASLALVLVAGPAAAEVPSQVTDPCGEDGTYVHNDPHYVPVEENKPHVDLDRAGISGSYDEAGTFIGFTASISVCGSVSATDGGYGLLWSYADGCSGGVRWTLGHRLDTRRGVMAGLGLLDEPRAVVSEACPQPGSTPPSTQIVYEVELPADATTFEADTVTFVVPVSALPAEAAQRFEPGTEWSHLVASAVDQTAGLWVGYRSEPDSMRGDVIVRSDHAFSDASYVVGEDRPMS